MENTVLTQDEMVQIKVRQGIVETKGLELQMLQKEKELYFKELLEKYKLDPLKKYSVDNRGIVTEAEEKSNANH